MQNQTDDDKNCRRNDHWPNRSSGIWEARAHLVLLLSSADLTELVIVDRPITQVRTQQSLPPREIWIRGPRHRAVESPLHSREWRNWQTRRIQVPVPVRVWGFKSPLAHHNLGTSMATESIVRTETSELSATSGSVGNDTRHERKPTRVHNSGRRGND